MPLSKVRKNSTMTFKVHQISQVILKYFEINLWRTMVVSGFEAHVRGTLISLAKRNLPNEDCVK